MFRFEMIFLYNFSTLFPNAFRRFHVRRRIAPMRGACLSVCDREAGYESDDCPSIISYELNDNEMSVELYIT